MSEIKMLEDIEDEADQNNFGIKKLCHKCGVYFYTKIPTRIYCDYCTKVKMRE